MIRQLLKSILIGFAAPIFFTGIGSADPTGVWLTPAGNSYIEIQLCARNSVGSSFGLPNHVMRMDRRKLTRRTRTRRCAPGLSSDLN